LDAVDREFELLAASVERTARVQRDEVRRFLETAPRGRLAPGGGGASSEDATPVEPEPRRGAALARHLSAAYDAVLSHVEERRADYETLPDADAKRGAVTEMRQLVAGARNLHRSLAWLDAAREPPLDLGTRYLVEWIAARLVAPAAEVTVVAGERSYGKVTNPLAPVFALSGAGSPPDELAIVIFVPRREQRSGLLHPLIIHELAHAADDQHRFVAEVLQVESERTWLVEAITAAAEEQAQRTGEDDASAVHALGARLLAWTEEAVCDAFAAQLLGPTYLYAFMAIVGTSDLDLAGEEHPPTRQRVRLMLEQLDELGWTELLKEASQEIDAWFREAAGIERDYTDPEERFCVEAVGRLAPEIRRVVAGHVADLTLDAEAFSVVHAEIVELLNAGIPPSQTLDRQRIDRAAIVLGSWLFAVQREGSDLAALARAADVPELSRLLPKALQDAALLDSWGAE